MNWILLAEVTDQWIAFVKRVENLQAIKLIIIGIHVKMANEQQYWHSELTSVNKIPTNYPNNFNVKLPTIICGNPSFVNKHYTTKRLSDLMRTSIMVSPEDLPGIHFVRGWIFVKAKILKQIKKSQWQHQVQNL